MEKIGKKLRILRSLQDYSQESVAHLIGISQKTYSRLENEDTSLTADLAHRLAKLYEIDKIDLYKFLEMDDKALIQAIIKADNQTDSLSSDKEGLDTRGVEAQDKVSLFKQIELQQEMIAYLLNEVKEKKRGV